MRKTYKTNTKYKNWGKHFSSNTYNRQSRAPNVNNKVIYIIAIIVGVAYGIYDDTWGGNSVHPHDGNTYFVGADGHKITLVHNTNATDSTYAKVVQFTLADSTDNIQYQPNIFTCGDYAERVQNNAENSGIKCGWVTVDFIGGESHACNVFNTTDKGLVFIDCTMYDSKVHLVDGDKYSPVNLNPDAAGTIDSLGVVKDYQIFW
jgi:hypothetical protein